MNSEAIFKEDIQNITDDLKSFYDEIEGKTILIAEGRGFLGTYFVNVLKHINTKISQPIKIVILDNLITSKEKKIQNAFLLICLKGSFVSDSIQGKDL